MPSLYEMARWRHLAHALPAYLLLGKVAGVAEQEVQGECFPGVAPAKVMVGNADGCRGRNHTDPHDRPDAAQPDTVGDAHQGGEQGGGPATDKAGDADGNRTAVEDEAGREDEGVEHPDYGHRPEEEAGEDLVGLRSARPAVCDEAVENAQRDDQGDVVDQCRQNHKRFPTPRRGA